MEPKKAAALKAVFAQVKRCLGKESLALETLEDYEADAANNNADIQRLRGFLQGLCAAKALSFEDYCEVDELLVSAFG